MIHISLMIEVLNYCVRIPIYSDTTIVFTEH